MIRTNLTLYSLPPIITDMNLEATITQACDNAKKLAEFAKEHRDKHIVHQDHGHAIKPPLFKLNGMSRQNVENVLEALRRVLRLVDSHYNDVDVRYENTVIVSAADRLVRALSRLQRLERLAAKGIERVRDYGKTLP